MKYVIAVDCGTTTIKALIYDMSGNPVSSAEMPNKVITGAEGKSEQDMDGLWQNTLLCLKDLLNNTEINKNDINAIGVTAQGEGLWGMDAQGQPVCNAVLWNDAQAVDIVEAVKAQGNLYNEIKLILGSYIRTGSTLTLIKWLKEKRPAEYARMRYIFSCKDWVRYKLTDRIFWEKSDASCSCMALTKNVYARDVFENLGISDAINKLPALIDATAEAGRLTPEMAAELGLNEIPVCGGMLDIVATAAGAGAVKENDICIILGTTGMTFTVLPEYIPDLEYNGWETHMEPGMFIKGMGTMAAMPNMNWALEMFFNHQPLQNTYDAIGYKLADYVPFQSGIIYHPHISTAGERAPFYDPAATAQFIGINRNSTRYDIIHAVMEGIALSVKDCLQDIKVYNNVYLTGGGTKNKVLTQILADVLGAELSLPSSAELAAKGAALAAGIMTGCIKDCDSFTASDSLTTMAQRIKPDLAKTVIYNELYNIYKSTQSAVEPFWKWRNQWYKA